MHFIPRINQHQCHSLRELLSTAGRQFEISHFSMCLLIDVWRILRMMIMDICLAALSVDILKKMKAILKTYSWMLNNSFHTTKIVTAQWLADFFSLQKVAVLVHMHTCINTFFPSDLLTCTRVSMINLEYDILYFKNNHDVMLSSSTLTLSCAASSYQNNVGVKYV